MEMGSTSQVLYEGNPPVAGGSPPPTKGGNHGNTRLDDLFVVSLNIL